MNLYPYILQWPYSCLLLLSVLDPKKNIRFISFIPAVEDPPEPFVGRCRIPCGTKIAKSPRRWKAEFENWRIRLPDRSTWMSR